MQDISLEADSTPVTIVLRSHWTFQILRLRPDPEAAQHVDTESDFPQFQFAAHGGPGELRGGPGCRGVLDLSSGCLQAGAPLSALWAWGPPSQLPATPLAAAELQGPLGILVVAGRDPFPWSTVVQGR